MKKIVALLLSFSICVSSVGCSSYPITSESKEGKTSSGSSGSKRTEREGISDVLMGLGFAVMLIGLGVGASKGTDENSR